MKVFAFDYETFLVAPGAKVPRAVSLAWDYGQGPSLVHSILEPRRYRDAIEEGLSADILTGVNVPFDLAVTVRACPDLLLKVWQAFDEHRVWDSGHTEKLCDLAEGDLHWQFDKDFVNKKTGKIGGFVKVGYSLADIVKRRFGVVLEKDLWRLRYGTLADVPCNRWPDGARKYALDDAFWHYQCWDVQAQEPLLKLVNLTWQTRAAWWLALMEARGFQVDAKQIDTLAQHIIAERDIVAARLADAGLVKNGKRVLAAAADRMILVCASRGVEVPRTPKGKVKLTKETTSDTGDPLLEQYARFTSLTNMFNGSLVTLQAASRAGMPIQSRFEVLQDTGRTSCSTGAKRKKGVDPFETGYGLQLQNVRRGLLDEDGEEMPGVRECFIPRPGYVLCSIDYGQLELCTWAQACIDLNCGSALADALNGGQDVHCLLGGMLIGRAYEEVLAAKKKEKWAKDARQMAKCGNFGLPGGLGADGLRAFAKSSYGVILDKEAAVLLKTSWHEMWPEAEKYFHHIHRVVGNCGEGQIRQLRSFRLRGGCSFTEAANGFFQALAADLAKDAGYEVSRACYAEPRSPLFGSYIVNFVHDELLLELPEARASEAAFEAARIMRDVGARWCPDVPPGCEPALMRRWYKDAEMKKVDGRLVPWERT